MTLKEVSELDPRPLSTNYKKNPLREENGIVGRTCKTCKRFKSYEDLILAPNTKYQVYWNDCKNCINDKKRKGNRISNRKNKLLREKGMKWCPVCKTPKALGDFHSNKASADGKTSLCKECKTVNAKFNQIFTVHRITKDEYLIMLKNQNNECKICNVSFKTLEPKFVQVDHCHETGKIRGVLCRACNTGLGQFKDNLKSLEKAIEYLKGNL